MNKAPQVFLWETSYTSEKDVKALLSSLPASDQQQADKIKRERRQIEFVCGRYLIRKVFSEKFQVSLPSKISTAENKKPSVEVFPPFNISHSKKFVSFALSGKEDIGLDIEVENKDRKILDIANSYGTPSEIGLLKALKEEDRVSAFYKIWSLKESFAKATGEGLNTRLQNLTFDFERSKVLQTPDEKQCVFFYSKYKNLHISVSVLSDRSNAPVVWEVKKTDQGFEYTELKNVHFEKFVFVVPSVTTYH